MTQAAWTYVQVLDESGKKINPIVFGYVIKRDGVKVGTLKHLGRPKSCGGAAWCGTITEGVIGSGVSFYHKDQRKVLEWFKSDYDGVMRSHSRKAA